jgi:anti-sigma B factor antagonist
MEIHTSTLGSAAVLRLEGRLNMVSASQLRSAIDGTVKDGTKHVVVDLSGTSFIDSSGLGALIAGLKRARQAGGDLRIAAPGSQVRTVLTLTNLDRVLRPHERLEDAVHGW